MNDASHGAAKPNPMLAGPNRMNRAVVIRTAALFAVYQILTRKLAAVTIDARVPGDAGARRRGCRAADVRLGLAIAGACGLGAVLLPRPRR